MASELVEGTGERGKDREIEFKLGGGVGDCDAVAFSEGCPVGGDGNKYRLRELARGELPERRTEGVVGLPDQRRSACSKEGYLGFDDDASRRIEPLHVWFQPRTAGEFKARFIARCWGVQPASLDEIRVRGSLIRAVI